MSDLAREFHDAYERLAPAYGYTTRQDTREFDPDSPNGKLMTAVCSEVLGGMEAEIERLREALQRLFSAGEDTVKYATQAPDRKDWVETLSELCNALIEARTALDRKDIP